MEEDIVVDDKDDDNDNDDAIGKSLNPVQPSVAVTWSLESDRRNRRNNNLCLNFQQMYGEEFLVEDFDGWFTHGDVFFIFRVLQ
jgi:hypothetical protein